MSQNISSAVMQQRSEPHDSLDFFPTPLWATRALCEHVLGGRANLSKLTCWEPACGEGHMSRALSEYFIDVHSSDIHSYGYGATKDFLFSRYGLEQDNPHWIITNPPFRLAEQFIERATTIAQNGVAMLVRIAFLESVSRYRNLFSQNPPELIAQFSERVPMFKGRIDATGSTATAYCWLIWRPCGRTEFVWIPPCRRQLERAGDYD